MEQELLQVKELFNNKDFNKALPILNKLLNEHPNDTQSLYFRAIALRHTDQLELSIADLSKAVSINPEDADIVAERAVGYIHLKQYLEALADMEKALQLDERAYRYSSRAFVKGMLKDYEGAIADYEKAIELDPEDEVAYNNLSLVQEKMGWKDKAQKNADKSMDLVKEKNGDAIEEARANALPKINEEVNHEKRAEIEKNLIEKVKLHEGVELSKEDANSLANKISIVEEKPDSKMQVMANVFKSKDLFKEFIQFVKNGFKLK